MLGESVNTRKRALDELSEPTGAGRDRRRALQNAVRHTRHEFHGLGVEMGQRYHGAGIHSADEAEPYVPFGQAAEDPVLYYEPSTYPGCRLPHVWLNRSYPEEPVSTIDLAGHGAFTFFTGPGGDAWKEAAKIIANKLCIRVQAHSIGFGQDWTDPYYDWERVRGVEESGLVLVRPDRFVAWRASEVLQGSEACERKLTDVMRSILCLN